jgi:hypothetical protein
MEAVYALKQDGAYMCRIAALRVAPMWFRPIFLVTHWTRVMYMDLRAIGRFTFSQNNVDLYIIGVD